MINQYTLHELSYNYPPMTKVYKANDVNELIEQMKEGLIPFSNAVLPTKDKGKPDDARVTCYFKLGDLRRVPKLLKLLEK